MISEGYRQEQAKLHENPNYGMASVSYAPLVTNLINQFNVTDLLDYGAGKGRLAENIKPDHEVQICMYEPSNPEMDDLPDPAEMVCCIDVLEHIEPEHLEAVLDHLQELTLSIGFFTIHTGPALKKLSDGRNAHLIQEPMLWWLSHIDKRFTIQAVQAVPNGFFVIVGRKCQSIIMPT
jgi:hypothetical protein